MSNIVANGITLPKLPRSGLQIEHEKIWSSNTGRTASGNMSGTLKKKKRKLSCSWKYITAEQYDLIESVANSSDAFFTVKYTLPGTTTQKSGTFYSGDLTSTVLSNSPDMDIVYESVDLDFIEK